MSYLALFIALPAKASTGRMRVWRALKALGCAQLRDGVHLLPDLPPHADALAALALQAVEHGGSAEVYRLSGCDEAQEIGLRALFDRTPDYAALVDEIDAFARAPDAADAGNAARRLHSLARRLEQLDRIDFYPGEAGRQARAMFDEARLALARRLSPDEPTASESPVERLQRSDYRGRTWATRARPWVDRLASAWLIRRRIDPDARFAWLASPADCREGWVGFDFDGASFSHTDARVSFEVLLASFGLDAEPALVRLGELVHALDVGGLPVPEAAGVEAVLAGLRAAEPDDDALLDRAGAVFDALLRGYEERSA